MMPEEHAHGRPRAGSVAVGALLQRLRLVAGFTQEQLAERAQVSARTISNLERGAHRPRADTIYLLARALGLTPEAEAALRLAVSDTGVGSSSTPGVVGEAPGSYSHPARCLPEPPTPLIGREHEQAQASALLAASAVRLLTLTGAGGVGKTRLALELTRRHAKAFADGAAFVPLAALGEAAHVPDTLAQALGVREEREEREEHGLPLIESVKRALRNRRLLLVLDNCEHLPDVAHLVADLLMACPGVTVLATSRAPLQLRGEHLLEIAPLALPAEGGTPASVEALAAVPSVALFLARAVAVRPDFALTPANATAVTAICRALDGLPLALELAAARLGLLSPSALLARLDDCLAVLTGGPRDLASRQQTLRATLDWSHDLLAAEEQATFRRLAVCAAGCTLEAAEAICAGTGLFDEAPAVPARTPAPDGESMLDRIQRLVEHHLLQREEMAGSAVEGEGDEQGEVRVEMLKTIREYARDRLRASGEAEAAARAHADYYLARAEAAEPHLRGPMQAMWIGRLERDQDNLRMALNWARRQHDVLLGLRLCGALWQFWSARGALTEGRDWLTGAIAQADGPGGNAVIAGVTEKDTDMPTERHAEWHAALAKALNGAGVLATRQGAYAEATAMHERALVLRRALGDTLGVASSLNNLGGIAMDCGDYSRARTLWEESLTLRRESGDPRAIAVALMNLGVLAHYQGEYARAVELLEQSLPMFRSIGDSGMLATALNSLGGSLQELRASEGAWEVVEESLTLARHMGRKRDIALALNNLAHIASQQGDSTHATALCSESLAITRALGDRWYIADNLTLLGVLAGRHGDAAQAESLLCEGLQVRQEIGHAPGVAQSLLQLGHLARDRGEWARAAAHYRASLLASRTIEARRSVAEGLEGLVGCLLVDGATRQAIRVCAAAAALRDHEHVVRAPSEQSYYERCLAWGLGVLGEERFAAAWAAGERLSVSQVITEALVVSTEEPTGERTERLT